jgi:hypothetical protein
VEPTQHHDAAAYRVMVDLTLKLILAGSFGDEPTAQASALKPAIAGPLALKAALRDYNGGSHDGARDELVGQLTRGSAPDPARTDRVTGPPEHRWRTAGVLPSREAVA